MIIIYRTKWARKPTDVDAPRRIQMEYHRKGETREFVVHNLNTQTGGLYLGAYFTRLEAAYKEYIRRCEVAGLDPFELDEEPMIESVWNKEVRLKESPNVPTEDDLVCHNCHIKLGPRAVEDPGELSDGTIVCGLCPECGSRVTGEHGIDI